MNQHPQYYTNLENYDYSSYMNSYNANSSYIPTYYNRFIPNYYIPNQQFYNNPYNLQCNIMRYPIELDLYRNYNNINMYSYPHNYNIPYIRNFNHSNVYNPFYYL